jgi:ribonucleoside-triphosphate reductase
MEVMSEIRSTNMFTFPVSTISLLRQNGKFADEDFAKWAIAHNMKWSDSNLFIDDSVTSLSNCCRLKSSIEDLGYFNSVGGTALKVGSIKVGTVNLARIALDTKTEEEYLEALRERVELDLMSLDVVRNIIKRNVEKGLLPNFSYGLIDFKHCYNTIGFIGVYETMKKFGYTYQDQFGNTFYDDKSKSCLKKLVGCVIGSENICYQCEKGFYLNNNECIEEQGECLIHYENHARLCPLYRGKQARRF